MDQSGGVVAVVVYLAILAFAVAWFLLPRWLKRRKADQLERSRRKAAGPAQVSDPELR
jgi:hypothetical protein